MRFAIKHKHNGDSNGNCFQNIGAQWKDQQKKLEKVIINIALKCWECQREEKSICSQPRLWLSVRQWGFFLSVETAWSWPELYQQFMQFEALEIFPVHPGESELCS